MAICWVSVCPVFGNDVTDVDVFLGATEQEAESASAFQRAAIEQKDSEGYNSYYVHVEGDAMGSGTGDDFTVKVYDDGALVAFSSNVPDLGPGYSREFEVTFAIGPGSGGHSLGRHHIRVKARRNNCGGPYIYDTDDGDKPAYVYVADLDITKVPEFLFANAVHATPISFRVKGFGNVNANVYLLGIEADLYLNGSCEEGDIPIGSRFTGGTTTARNNGSYYDYTGYINHGEYSATIPDVHWTDDANFVVRVTCRDTEVDYWKHASVTVESELSDPEAGIDKFGDTYLRAVQANPPTVGYGEKTEVINLGDFLQAKVDWPADSTKEENYQHWQRGDFHDCDECTESIPHDITDDTDCKNLINNQQCGGFDHIVNELERTSNGMTARTEIGDDHDVLWCEPPPSVVCWCGARGSGQGVKVRRYLVRRGGFFYISYQGKELSSGVLDGGEYAMDLADSSGDFAITAFDSGSYRFTNDQDVGSGVNLAGGPLVLGILSCLAGLPNVPWWVGAGVNVAGTAESLVDAFADLEDEDTDSGISGRAQGVVRKKLYRCRPSGTVEQKNYTPYPECHEDTGGPGTWNSYGIGELSENWDVGDQFIFFIELDSASSAVSLPCSENPTSVFISQKTEFRCTNQGDWTQATVTMDDS
jgi:hypothetical protein